MKDLFDQRTSALSTEDFNSVLGSSGFKAAYEPPARNAVKFAETLAKMDEQTARQQTGIADFQNKLAREKYNEFQKEQELATKAQAKFDKERDRALAQLPEIDPTAQVLPTDWASAKKLTNFDAMPYVEQTKIMDNWKAQVSRAIVTGTPSKVDTVRDDLDKLLPDPGKPKADFTNNDIIDKARAGGNNALASYKQLRAAWAGNPADQAAYLDEANQYKAAATAIEQNDYSAVTKDQDKAAALAGQQLNAKYGGQDNVGMWEGFKQGASDMTRGGIAATIGNIGRSVAASAPSAVGNLATVAGVALTPAAPYIGVPLAVAGRGLAVAGGAAATASDVAGTVMDEINKLEPSVFANNEIFRAAKARGLSDTAARQELAMTAARQGSVAGAGIGAVSGAVGAFAGAGALGVKSAATAILRKYAVEAVSEGVEEGVTQAVGNRIVQNAGDSTRSVMRGVGSAAAQGAIAGVGISAAASGTGAAVNLATGAPETVATRATNTPATANPIAAAQAAQTAAQAGAPTPTANGRPTVAVNTVNIGGVEINKVEGVWTANTEGEVPAQVARAIDGLNNRDKGASAGFVEPPVEGTSPYVPKAGPVAIENVATQAVSAPASPAFEAQAQAQAQAPAPVDIDLGAPAAPENVATQATNTPASAKPLAEETPYEKSAADDAAVRTVKASRDSQMEAAYSVDKAKENTVRPTAIQKASGIGLTVEGSIAAGQKWGKQAIAQGNEALRAIASNPTEVGDTTAQVARMVGEAFDAANIPLPLRRPTIRSDASSLGNYKTGGGVAHSIAFSKSAGPKTIIHEYIHALTVEGLYKIPGQRGVDIRAALLYVVEALKTHPLVERVGPSPYGLKNEREAMAEMFSPQMLPLLARIPVADLIGANASDKVRSGLAYLQAQPQSTVRQLFETARNLVLKALGINPVDKNVAEIITNAAAESANNFNTGARNESNDVAKEVRNDGQENGQEAGGQGGQQEGQEAGLQSNDEAQKEVTPEAQRLASYWSQLTHPESSGRVPFVSNFMNGTLPSAIRAMVDATGTGISVEGSLAAHAPWAMAAATGQGDALVQMAGAPADVGSGVSAQAQAVLRMYTDSGTKLPTVETVKGWVTDPYDGSNQLALYDQKTHKITISESADAPTLLHEYAHGVSVKGLDAMGSTQEGRDLVSLISYLRAQLNTYARETGQERVYGATDKYEMLADFFNPKFVALASQVQVGTPAAPSAKRAYDRIMGMEAGTIAQAINKIITALMRAVGAKPVENNIAQLMARVAERVQDFQDQAPLSDVETKQAQHAVLPTASLAQAVSASTLTAQGLGRTPTAALLQQIRSGTAATPAGLGRAVVQSIGAKDGAEVKSQGAKFLRGLNEAFHDSVTPAKDWILGLGKVIGEPSAKRLEGLMYLAPGKRDAVMANGFEKHGGKALQQALFEASKGSKLSLETIQSYAGYWLTATHVPSKNQALTDRDAAAHTDAIAAAAADPNNMALQDAADQAAEKMLDRLAEIHSPDLNAGSLGPRVAGVAGGMNNAQAAAFLVAVESQIPLEKLQEIAKHTYAINAWRLALDVETGKADPLSVVKFLNNPNILPDLQALQAAGINATDAQRDAVRALVATDYVPMTGHPLADIDGGEDGMFGTGTSMPNTGKDFQMEGRTQGVADDGIATTFASAIRSATFAGFADFTSALGEAHAAMSEEQRKAVGLEQIVVNGVVRMGDNVVLDGRKGNKIGYRIENQKVLGSIRKANMDDQSRILTNTVGVLTKGFGYLVTQANPVFAPKNMVNDLIERSQTLRTRDFFDEQGNKIDSAGLDKTMLSVWTSGRPLRATFRAVFGNADNSPEGQALRALVANGGASTFSDLFARSRSDLVRGIAENGGVLSNIGLRKLGRGLERYNKMFDLVSPLVSYMALKQHGVSDIDAAAGALDLMNFRKVGTAMPNVKAVYAFAGPAVIGGANMVSALKTRRGQVRFAVYLGLAAGLQTLSSALSDEDEGGKIVDQLPGKVRENSLPFEIGGVIVKVPIGFGATRLANNVVKNVRDISIKDTDVSTAIWSIIKGGAVPALTPFDPPEIKETTKLIGYGASPTVLKPFFGIAMNVTSFGSPVVNEKFMDQDKFRHLQGNKNTAQFYKDMAKEWHGVIGHDVAPEEMKAMFEGYALGPLREVLNLTVTNPDKEAKGKVGAFPLVNSLATPVTDTGKTVSFYKAQEAFDDMRKENASFADAVAKGQKPDAEARAANAELNRDPLFKLALQWDETDKELKAEKSKVTKALGSRQITPALAESRTEAIKVKRQAAMDKWLVKYRTAKGLS